MLSSDELKTKFPSLASSLASTSPPILALYFASSWCPDCTGVTPVLHTFFLQERANKLFDLVYISSDNTEEQLKNNVPSASWGVVPFENVDERSNLKRHFGACAAKEVSVLEMSPEDRKSGIPTLILLEKATGKLLTRDGVDDMMADPIGAAAVQKWKEMLQ